MVVKLIKKHKPIEPKWFYIGLKKDEKPDKILSEKEKINLHEDIEKIEKLSKEFNVKKIICITECKHIKSVINDKEINKKTRIQKMKSSNEFPVDKIFKR